MLGRHDAPAEPEEAAREAAPVGRRREQEPAGTGHAGELGQVRDGRGQMLQHLEADDEVEGAAGERRRDEVARVDGGARRPEALEARGGDLRRVDAPAARERGADEGPAAGADLEQAATADDRLRALEPGRVLRRGRRRLGAVVVAA